ncbi:MAG: NAD-binding protein [Ardenticatenales bacterium]
MNIVVIGCGRLGAELALRLFRQGHDVAVVDQTSDAFSNLPPEFRGRLIEGEVLNRDVLTRADIAAADAVAVVTNSDAVNVVVGHVAREVYGVANVAVRNFDPRRRRLQEAFGLPIVSSAVWGAGRFESILTTGSVHAVLSAGNGEVQVFEVPVPEGCAGQTIAQLLEDGSLMAVAHTRHAKATLPAPDTALAPGDVLLVSGSVADAKKLQLRLAAGQEN